MNTLAPKKRIVILGGGFAGIATARHLERLFRRRPDVEIDLVSRDNFLVVTPLLFEVFRRARSALLLIPGSGRLGCHAVHRGDRPGNRFGAARRSSDRCGEEHGPALRSVGARDGFQDEPRNDPRLGACLHIQDAGRCLLLRNQVIERFEQADVETDPQRKEQLLTFVVIGGGLVGVELLGELTSFVDGIVALYEHVDRGEVRFVLLQSGDRIMPEIDPALAAYGARVLMARCGVDLRTNTRVRAIEPGKVHVTGGTVATDTIILAAGVKPNPIVAGLPVEKDKSGRMVVEPTLRCSSHPDVWALGDCASIPGPDDKPYPGLAQHALREAKVLAKNIFAALDCQPAKPFIYDTMGKMGSLGHSDGFGQLLKVRLHGFPAWFIRRTYYLSQTPGWARKLRIMIDWTFALLFRPDVVKVGLDSETASLLREVALDEVVNAEHGEPLSHELARV
jgi:NADH dehydrogenase